MPAPRLVAEVVSPGDENHRRNYTAKHKQYQERSIPECWLLNPETKTIEILELVEGKYVCKRFQADDPIEPPTFKNLNLTANQVFAAGR